MDIKRIRNFAIIAHIDHGKSTLADRLIQECGGILSKDMTSQVLDTMDIEKERGITIKAQSMRLNYLYKGEEYILNLIDTPGHVDFSYEVSRSLACSEGALLVVDAMQGIEAQTIANVYTALENNLEIIPVINKIDLPLSKPEDVALEIEESIGLDASKAIFVSAKTGVGIKELLNSIITRVPPPTLHVPINANNQTIPQSKEIKESKETKATPPIHSSFPPPIIPHSPPPKHKNEEKSINKPALRALIYDSWFDNYLGALGLIRVFVGEVNVGDEIFLLNQGSKHEVLSLSYPHPLVKKQTKRVGAGEIAIINLGIKDISFLAVGDTISSKDEEKNKIEGFKPAKAFVYAGLYPIDTHKFEVLRDALNKLKLNDAALYFEPESSVALGFGFRCGFLGLLHMDVIRERLEREFNLNLIVTAPTVTYLVHTRANALIEVRNPSDLPNEGEINFIEEPFVKASIITPKEYLGNLIVLLSERRGNQLTMDYITQSRVLLEYEIPSNEIVLDFYDKLKSLTRGYASFDYTPIGNKKAKLVKLDIKIANEVVDALSIIVDKQKAYEKGKELIEKMKDLIPRQLFEVSLQACMGSKVIARETIKAMGKNVTAKCYGGDISRKRKLLEKQKEGKKRMKQIGRIELPKEAFLTVLKIK